MEYIIIGLAIAIVVGVICYQGGIVRRSGKKIDIYEYSKDESSGSYTPLEIKKRLANGYYDKKDK